MKAETDPEQVRLQFAGLSQESFEDAPEIGEERTYTVRVRCTARSERAMANEGTRITASLKVEQVHDGGQIPNNEGPSLFDRGGFHLDAWDPHEGERVPTADDMKAETE